MVYRSQPMCLMKSRPATKAVWS